MAEVQRDLPRLRGAADLRGPGGAMTTPREIVRAAYLYGVQEGAQATVERVCDEYADDLPPRVHAALWDGRHRLAAEMRELTVRALEELGEPEAIASIPVEK